MVADLSTAFPKNLIKINFVYLKNSRAAFQLLRLNRSLPALK
jgi:hypothetical protein